MTFASKALRGLLYAAVFPVMILAESTVQAASDAPTVAAARLNPEALQVYERAGVQLEEVDFFKPAGRMSEELHEKLAPLILAEALISPDSQSNEERCRPVIVINDEVKLNRSGQPTVYFDIDSVTVAGTLRPRLSYIWFSRDEHQRGHIVAQGVRLTLDRMGRPAIWEIMTDPTGFDIAFVSRAVENAAAAEYGKPIEGRRFSVEASAEKAACVVARVIEDGPVPMGPTLYLRAEQTLVSTLICRCMPAQAKRIRNTAEYQLTPWSAVSGIANQWKRQHQGKLSFWPRDETTPIQPEQRLRLPKSF